MYWIFLVWLSNERISVTDTKLQLLHNDDHHILSQWDTVTHQPFENCYTKLLYDEIPNSVHNPVVMLGLGGGILSARLALVGINTTVVEVSETIIGTYHAVFEPELAQWAPVHQHVNIVLGDAFDLTMYENVSNQAVVVFDIPQCYRDASMACGDLIKKIAETYNALVIVNVWRVRMAVFSAAMRVRGRFVRENEQGCVVWTNML